LDDVRYLSKDKYGEFDVVLALGILYHLDVPDSFHFVEKIYEVCRRVAILDTHISLTDTVSHEWKGKTFWGRHSEDHDPKTTPEERLKAVWDSLDNPRSFQMTRASLCNLLRFVGFSSVSECLSPIWSWGAGDQHILWEDRVTLVALKGRPQPLLSSPVTTESLDRDRPEKPEYYQPREEFRPGKPPSPPPPPPPDSFPIKLRRRLGKVLPGPVKGVLKK